MLIDYAHGELELEGESRTNVARHLAGCPECALEYCRLQADLQGIVEANTEAPRARVYHMLRRRVATEHGRRTPWWQRARRAITRPIPMYGAVLASLVPVLVWVAATWSRPHAEPPRAALPPARDAALTDYDATEVLPAHRDVL
jgi:anti-sigma factor RsiW